MDKMVKTMKPNYFHISFFTLKATHQGVSKGSGP